MNPEQPEVCRYPIQVYLASFPDTLEGTVAALKEPHWVKKLCRSVGANDLRNQGTVKVDLLYNAKTTFKTLPVCSLTWLCIRHHEIHKNQFLFWENTSHWGCSLVQRNDQTLNYFPHASSTCQCVLSSFIKVLLRGCCCSVVTWAATGDGLLHRYGPWFSLE